MCVIGIGPNDSSGYDMRTLSETAWLKIICDYCRIKATELERVAIDFNVLNDSLQSVPERSFTAIIHRYEYAKTYRDVGKIIGPVSACRASQITARAIRRLPVFRQHNLARRAIIGLWNLGWWGQMIYK